jgi:hypothetical protein
VAFLLGIFISLPIVFGALDESISVFLLPMYLLYSFLGLIFPRTVGTSLVTVQIASAIGSLIGLLTWNLSSIAVCIGIFIVCFAGQHLIVRLRPMASMSVGATKSTSSTKAKAQEKFYENAINNYHPNFWKDQHSLVEAYEIPLGQIVMRYRIPLNRIAALKETHGKNEIQITSDEFMLKYLEDSYYSCFVARYTDDAIYFHEPQGKEIIQELEFTFHNDQRVAFADIVKFEILNTDKQNVIFTMKSEVEDFDLVLDTDLSNKNDLECVIKTWEANSSIDKFKLIAQATNDPRIKFIRDITIDPIPPGFIDQVDELESEWYWLSKNFKKDYSDQSGIFKVTDFMDSNREKLRVIGDGRIMFTYSFPTLAFYNSMFHRIMGGHLGADFDSGLAGVNKFLLEHDIDKSDSFDDLVIKTREILNHPRAKATLRDLRFGIPNS